ncbi:NADH:flavin oxidoreductase/NADH oxidase [Flavobacterium sp. JP2137]|uniref:NADH:flavin oxidoreductase/NADH oxidase n=1 Tax=Flavobacterium sp. JP2137 TaxID=3414510 RepID=UPI003D2FD326
MIRSFQPLRLENLELKNRFVVSPMCQYSSEDGFATAWHLVHTGQFAIGQAAAIIQEATAVTPDGRISYGDLGIWKDEHITKLAEITAFVKSQGSIPGIQLSHAGRKASSNKPWLGREQLTPDHENGWQTRGLSAIPFRESEHPPLPLGIAEIKALVVSFREAAARAIKAGYQIIELHGAHGYLIHQFFSPLINTRTDEYGGSFDNRIRFLLEVIDAVKLELTADSSLWVRISATDWAAGGWDLESSIQLAAILKERGVEVIDVSTGGAVAHQKITAVANYQVPFATAIKEQTGMTTGCVGLIAEAQQAEDLLQNDQADLIFIARAFLRDPHFVLSAAKTLGHPIAWPKAYERASL